MDTAVASQPDVEHGVDGKGEMNKKSLAFLEAGAMLTIWSLLVINEGAIRLIQANPSQGLFSGDARIKPFFPFIGGLFEVFFGLLGLFLGMGALLLRWYSTLATKVSMAVQTVFGYFVLLVFVFALPAVAAVDRVGPGFHPALSVAQNRFLIAMGIMTSFHFCLALQGGQFLFMARLISTGSGRDFLKQQSGNKMRAVFWNMNLALSGLWTLITGALINAEVGGGELSDPFFSAPNVGTLPGMTITAGLLMLVWGLVGAVLAMSGGSPPALYYVGSAFVYLFAYLNYTIVQLGQINVQVATPLDGATALHGGLVFMVVTLGPYFVLQADRDRRGLA